MLLPPSCSYCANLVYGLLCKGVGDRIRQLPFFDMLKVKTTQLTWHLTEIHIIGKNIINKRESCKIFSESAKSSVKVLIATNFRLSATQLFQ